MTAYYNEIDPFAVQWLRCLMAMGYIADGIVDDRSISDVTPNDLKGFDQCHFFAGIGVWSHSLRLAGWPDDRPVWTGSCPCQPFSAAGVGKGFDDERHLWPHFEWLIRQCNPAIVFGEQVASKAVEPWIDLVQADLEELGYAFGCAPFPSAGVGAPHIRDRAFWVADSISQRSQRRVSWWTNTQRQDIDGHVGRNGTAGAVANTSAYGWIEGLQQVSGGLPERAGSDSELDGVADATGDRRFRSRTSAEAEEGLRKGSATGGQLSERLEGRGLSGEQQASLLGVEGVADAVTVGCAKGRTCNPAQKRDGVTGNSGFIEAQSSASPVNGFWRDADWLFCRDGKWRPVEPGTFPLVDGASARVGRLRGYGNAINAQAAKAFIEAFTETDEVAEHIRLDLPDIFD